MQTPPPAGFNKTSTHNYFVYADYTPIKLARAAAAVAGRAGVAAVPRVSPGGPPLGSGWNACVMSYGTHTMPTDLTDVWRNNTCLTANAAFFAFNSCDENAPLNGTIPLFSGNTWATDAGSYEMSCGKAKWSLAQAQALGVDTGSIVIPMPSTADIVAAGRALLQMA